jgi:hypothetical protein
MMFTSHFPQLALAMPQFPRLNYQFKHDWEQFVKKTKAQGAVRRQSNNNNKSLSRSLIKGLGVVNGILNAANGNGGGGQTFVSNDNSGGTFDSSLKL